MPLLTVGIMPLKLANDFDLVLSTPTTEYLAEPFDTERRVSGIAFDVHIRELNPFPVEHIVDFVVMEDNQSPPVSTTARAAISATNSEIWMPCLTGCSATMLKFSFAGQDRPSAEEDLGDEGVDLLTEPVDLDAQQQQLEELQRPADEQSESGSSYRSAPTGSQI